MTTQSMISEWFDRGIAQQATHMIVVCDTFDHGDYPVFVTAGEDARKKVEDYNQNMQRVMEVYDLQKPKQPQLNAYRAWNL